MTMPLDPTPTPTPSRYRFTWLDLSLAVLPLIAVGAILTDSLYKERARADEAERVLAFRDCIGHVTDIVIEANPNAEAPTMMSSAAVTRLCDTLTLKGGVR